MSKTVYGYKIEDRVGADIHEKDAPQSVKIVPDNKTLIALPLNDEPDDSIEPVRVKSINEAFEKYQPEKEVELKDKEGNIVDGITLKFDKIKDFTKDGIVEQIPLLQQMQEEKDIYAKFADVLQNNDRLKDVLSKPEYTEKFVELLDTLIEELDGE